MNSTSINDYILKLERENRELQILRDEEECETIRALTLQNVDLKKQVRDLKKSSETHEESRTKIEQLKELLDEANKEKVAALNSLYHTTARVTEKKCVNQGLVDRLLKLGEMTSDFYKTATYNRGAEIIRGLDYEVESGESVIHRNGIGKGIASKVDQFLEEHFDDSESVTSNEGQLLEDSDDEAQIEELSNALQQAKESTASAEADLLAAIKAAEAILEDSDSDDEFFISYNSELADALDGLAYHEENEYKSAAYARAAHIIDRLPFKVTSAAYLAMKELCDGIKMRAKNAAEVIHNMD